MEWLTDKPIFKDDCVLITASLYHCHWEYNTWIIEHRNGYWNWLTRDGEEYGDIEDLKADRYCILSEPPKQ